MTVEFFGVSGMGQIGGVNKTTRAGNAQKSGKTEGKESASFSSALQGANKAQAMGGIEDPQRTDRIQEIKAQVANGSYEPDLTQVASSLLKFLVEEG